MKKSPELTTNNTVIFNEYIFNDDELKQLAKLLDALLEIDFEINRNKGLPTNAC